MTTFIPLILRVAICFIAVALSAAHMTSYAYGGKIGTGTLVDARDGATYKTITIGNQVWLAENIRFNSAQSLCPDIKERACSEFGRFYTFADAMMVCPAGWHIPDQREWDVLLNHFGGNRRAIAHLQHGGSAKFGALFGGVFAPSVGQLLGFGEWEIFWANVEHRETQEALTVYLHHEQGVTYHFNTILNYNGVRCLQD